MASKITKCFMLGAAGLLFSLSAFAQLRLPEGYFWKKLPNGLQVLVIENNKVPLVSIQIAVKNGSFTEDSVYNGLSHLFEHMFFKANKDYPTQALFLKRINQLGALFNGSTNTERVNYFITLNNDSLKAGLQFLNSAVRFPLYDKEEMRKERLVVDGEFQMGESDPKVQLYHELSIKLWGDLFTRKNPIGIHEIINTATPEKMLVIKNRYYVPNNSLLIICGDVKHEQSFKWAEEIYGDWASSGSDPIQKYPIPAFKPLTKSDYFVKESTIARTPYIFCSWHGPAYQTDSASMIAADVFSIIISLNSSKFQQALVNTGLATYGGQEYDQSRYAGEIGLYIEPNPNKLKECYEAIEKQIGMFAAPDYFTDEQLKYAKAILLRNDVRNKEKPSSLPDQVSKAWCSESLNYYTDKTANYQKVTRQDIKRYLETYVIGKPRVAGIILDPQLNKKVNAAAFFVAK